jgi:hypothetical protein
MLDCDAYTADWIWKKLVSEENEIKGKMILILIHTSCER